MILILVSQRAEEKIWMLIGDEHMQKHLLEDMSKQRGIAPTPLDGLITVYVLGFIWQEMREV